MTEKRKKQRYMRDCGCYCFVKRKGKLVATGHTACWSSLQNFYPYGSGKIKEENREIYIANFDTDLTQRHQKRLLWIINKITPCSIEEIEGRRYIKFRLLDSYDRSLILLNFIRNLWFKPIKGYVTKFFKALRATQGMIQDPLETLTWANKEACYEYASMSGPGHSNVYGSKVLKVKKTDQLKMWNGRSTQQFLTS